MIQTNRMGRVKNGRFRCFCMGCGCHGCSYDGDSIELRKQPIRSSTLPFAFADVSNLHCGFIRLFPKRRVTLVEGLSRDRQKVLFF